MADGSRVHNVRGVLAMQDSKNKMAAVKVAGKISAGLVFRVCYTVRVPTTNCHSGKSEHRNVGASERNLNPNPPCCYGAQERETRALHISYCTLCTVSVFDNIIMYRVHWSKQVFLCNCRPASSCAVCCMLHDCVALFHAQAAIRSSRGLKCLVASAPLSSSTGKGPRVVSAPHRHTAQHPCVWGRNYVQYCMSTLQA